MQWLWRYLTYDRGARLISGDYVESDNPDAAPIPRERLRLGTPWQGPAEQVLTSSGTRDGGET